MFKLDLEKAEESEIKLTTSAGSSKKQVSSRKTSTSALLYAGQEATVRNGHRTTDRFQIGKGIHQDCMLSLCLFNLYAEYIMRNTGLEKHKLEPRLRGEISIISDMQMTRPYGRK